MVEPKSPPASKARADAIHAEIDKLTSESKPTAGANKTPAKPPSNPRDYINEWMAEHDKKP
jgi:hypothetical protein